MTKDRIGTSGIAVIFGMPKTNFAAIVDHVEGFPTPVAMDGSKRVYSLKQVMQWAARHESPGDVLRQCYRDYQSLTRYGDNPKTARFNRNCFEFITGKYDPYERRRARDIRLQAARSSSSTRKTVTVTVETEWR